MLERFQLHERDTVYLVETEEDILITPFDPSFSEAMQIYQEGARAFRNALHE
ncbi:MAG: AbrB family transcriptional regulator [Gemmatimonadota bacterium]|nr:AbrB family transcriptional regulator [Gemmatimonadota bacterium]